ncbi:MAG: sigma-70 family RNA polymerase sigma factor [Firmicutes bacterium]|nr:sigma-70 family RNA polymerase sigma factor [Bacillota bacterium]
MKLMKKTYKNLEELYLDNEKLVYTFFFDYFKDKELILEWSQNLWVKVWKNFDKFCDKEKKEVHRYLRVMARNLVSDYFREENREQEAWEKWNQGECLETPTLENESELFSSPQLLDFLIKALEVLTETERDLVYLSYDQKLRSANIGQLLGISDGLVRVRLQRIREKLKMEVERLQKEGDTYE